MLYVNQYSLVFILINNILIALDSQSCLLIILTNTFTALFSSLNLNLIIKPLVHCLHLNKKVWILWLHNHFGIASKTDYILLSSFLIFSAFPVVWSTSSSSQVMWNTWLHKWSSFLYSMLLRIKSFPSNFLLPMVLLF